MRRASIGLLLAAALFVCVPPAWARTSTQEGDFEGRALGDVTITWHGDSARGCAAAGVCGMSGSITFQPDLVDVFGAFRPDGRFYPGEATILSSSPAVVRTRRDASGTPSVCLDLVDAQGVALSPTEQPGGRYRFDISTAHSFTGGLSSGRCTGPTAKQLETVFPSGLLQASVKGHRSRLIDLTGRKSFTAGPFSGEVVSTVSARLWPYRYDDEGDDGSADSSPRPHTRTIRLLSMDFEYRVASMAGSLMTTFNGSAQPFCVPFDSCGVSGTSSYSTTIKDGDLVVGGLRKLRRGEKATRRSAMRELRAGKLGVSGDSVLPEGALARIVSTIRYPDGTSCADPEETTQLSGLGVAYGRTVARFVLGTADYDRGTLLRSDCQGPLDDDVLGSDTPLATGSVPVTALGAKSLDVDLSAAGRFSSGGYTGTRSGTMALHLVRKSVHFRIERVKVSGVLFGS
jgi:hypothetical protein